MKSVIMTVAIEFKADDTVLKAPQYAPEIYKPATPGVNANTLTDK